MKTPETMILDSAALSDELLEWLGERNPSLFVVTMALIQTLAVALEGLGPELAPDAITLIHKSLSIVEASFKREAGLKQ